MKQVLFIKKDSGDLTSVWFQIVRHRTSVVHVCAYGSLVVLSMGCSNCVCRATTMVLRVRGAVGAVMMQLVDYMWLNLALYSAV